MRLFRQESWNGLPRSSRGSFQPKDWTQVSCLLHWLVDSLPPALPENSRLALVTLQFLLKSLLRCFLSPAFLKSIQCHSDYWFLLVPWFPPTLHALSSFLYPVFWNFTIVCIFVFYHPLCWASGRKWSGTIYPFWAGEFYCSFNNVSPYAFLIFVFRNCDNLGTGFFGLFLYNFILISWRLFNCVFQTLLNFSPSFWHF